MPSPAQPAPVTIATLPVSERDGGRLLMANDMVFELIAGSEVRGECRVQGEYHRPGDKQGGLKWPGHMAFKGTHPNRGKEGNLLSRIPRIEHVWIVEVLVPTSKNGDP